MPQCPSNLSFDIHGNRIQWENKEIPTSVAAATIVPVCQIVMDKMEVQIFTKVISMD